MKSFVNKKIFIESNEYTYRVEHLTLEGTCSTDNGPRNVKIKNLLVDKYPVNNQQYSLLLKKTNENEEGLFLDKNEEIELTDEINNARKKRRRSSASIE